MCVPSLKRCGGGGGGGGDGPSLRDCIKRVRDEFKTNWRVRCGAFIRASDLSDTTDMSARARVGRHGGTRPGPHLISSLNPATKFNPKNQTRPDSTPAPRRTIPLAPLHCPSPTPAQTLRSPIISAPRNLSLSHTHTYLCRTRPVAQRLHSAGTWATSSDPPSICRALSSRPMA